MSGHKTRLPGYRLTKAGKLEPNAKHLDASARARQRGSKRIRAVNPLPASEEKPPPLEPLPAVSDAKPDDESGSTDEPITHPNGPFPLQIDCEWFDENPGRVLRIRLPVEGDPIGPGTNSIITFNPVGMIHLRQCFVILPLKERDELMAHGGDEDLARHYWVFVQELQAHKGYSANGFARRVTNLFRLAMMHGRLKMAPSVEALDAYVPMEGSA